jgi:uncharacterized tellurite resistance protein B-like protein
MGLFDKLTGTKNVQLTPKSALVLSAITVIASDGVLDEAELVDLAKIVRGDRRVVDTAIQVLKAKTQLPEIMKMITDCLNEKQRIATIAIILDMAMADGVLAASEEKLIQEYITMFGLSDEVLKPIFDTIAIKNDFSVFA